MTVDARTWPSAAKALVDALYTQFELAQCGTRLPYPLELPAVQVRRLGGFDNGVTDQSRVDVVVIAETEDEAELLSEQIRTFLITTSPIRGAGLLLDGATTETAPFPVPYADSTSPDRAQFVATYLVTSRRF